MMYRLNPPLIQINDYLHQLEEQSKQGYRLVSVGLINKYEKYDHPVKYQILNEKPNEEMLNSLEILGYYLIDEYKGLSLFI